MDSTGKTRVVESYSHDIPIEGATEIGEIEFNQYLASLPESERPESQIQKEWKKAKTIEKKLELIGKLFGLDEGQP